MMVPVSRQLGRFEIRQKLGRGGMADVYLAQDTAGGYTVALKVIEHSADLDTRESIEAERSGATLQARLADIDPHVVRIYDAGDIDGFFFVAMEYVPGEDLAEVLRRQRLEPARACAIALAVCTTLHHAHTLNVTIGGKEYHGIVHGDIKPKNIRIDPKGNVRVLDFGIAKALSLSRRLTRNEFGSVPYASPERLDSGEVNQHSDLWSLAVMLYEMVAGVQPYHAPTTERLERMIRSRIPPPPAPDPCPEPLRRILGQALAPDEGQRYAEARSFASDLQAFLDGRPVSASSEEDRDSTRRTSRSPEAYNEQAEATRRTTGVGSARRSPDPVPAVPKRRNWRLYQRVIASLLLILMGWGGYATASSYLLWKRGRTLDRDVSAELVTDPDQIWTRWVELSRGSPSSLLLWGARRTVRQHLTEAADHVINSYRINESQPVYEKDWERARAYLAHALELDPGDASVRGRLRLVEGHLARIRGTNQHSAPLLNDAVVKFGEAQQLLPKLPDPQLGLARVYVYGLRDIDKAYDALEQAGRHGYKLGNREKGLLADGYRDRADRLWWDSRNIRGLPQEKDQIRRAADDYRRALELYQGIVPYGNASANIVRVERSLESVDFRLQQLEEDTQVGGYSK
jgi:serine/threonine-protein kinase